MCTSDLQSVILRTISKYTIMQRQAIATTALACLVREPWTAWHHHFSGKAAYSPTIVCLLVSGADSNQDIHGDGKSSWQCYLESMMRGLLYYWPPLDPADVLRTISTFMTAGADLHSVPRCDSMIRSGNQIRFQASVRFLLQKVLPPRCGQYPKSLQRIKWRDEPSICRVTGFTHFSKRYEWIWQGADLLTEKEHAQFARALAQIAQAKVDKNNEQFSGLYDEWADHVVRKYPQGLALPPPGDGRTSEWEAEERLLA